MTNAGNAPLSMMMLQPWFSLHPVNVPSVWCFPTSPILTLIGIDGDVFDGTRRLFHSWTAHSACLQILGSHVSIHAIDLIPAARRAALYGAAIIFFEMNVLPVVGGLIGVELSRGSELSTLWYWLPFVVVPFRFPPIVRAAVWFALTVLLLIFSEPSVTTVAASASISLLASRSYIPASSG